MIQKYCKRGIIFRDQILSNKKCGSHTAHYSSNFAGFFPMGGVGGKAGMKIMALFALEINYNKLRNQFTFITSQ